jgi:hypothetical protein
MPDFLAEVLTWPKNYSYTLAVQTAMDLHMPPTTFIMATKQPTDPWTAIDKKLALAWTVLNRETCKECGQPLWICRSSNKNLNFSVRTDVCYAKAELDKFSKGKEFGPGEHPYIVPFMRDETEKFPARAEYIEELNEED